MPVVRGVRVGRFCVNATMVVILVCAGTSGTVLGQPQEPSAGPIAHGFANSLPVLLVENRGVYGSEARYFAKHRQGVILFEDHGITLRRQIGAADARVNFPGARAGVRVEGVSRREAVVSYFRGPEDQWKTGLATFGAVMWRDLWSGIDLIYRAGRDELKYEFVVHPGADPTVIRMRYDGASALLRIGDHGQLQIEADGLVREDPAPVAWQLIDGKRVPVAVQFGLRGSDSRTVEFKLGQFDRDHELVLDPAVIAYCGYAGTSMDSIIDIAVDHAGAVYLVGTEKHNGIFDGVRVMKVAPDGSGLAYLALIDGANLDGAGGIAVDSAGCAYISGTTNSDERSFPVKVGPDLTFNISPSWPVEQAAFVCKLLPSGTSIAYCGYLGGTERDLGRRIAVDSAGCAWLTGATASRDFPVIGKLQAKTGSWADAWVVKVKPDGSGLLLSGCIGGWWQDLGIDVALDSQGHAYVAGYTDSDETTFPVKVGPNLIHSPSTFLRNNDIFVAKLDGATGAIQYCGFIGGANHELTSALEVDVNGAVYVCGITESDETTFPVKVGPFPNAHLGPTGSTGFLAKVMPSGSRLEYCGFLPDGYCFGVAVDSAGNAFVAGSSMGVALPVSAGPSSIHSGSFDAYVAKVPPTGKGFAYCGFIGGDFDDQIDAITADARGNVFGVGRTNSNPQSFPLKVGPSLTYNGMPGPGGYNASFVVKVAETVLYPSGLPRIGTSLGWRLTATNDSGNGFQLGTSLGVGPISIDSRQLGLSVDELLRVSTTGVLPGVFSGYSGVFDSMGRGAAVLNIPNLKLLIGVNLHTAFVTIDATAPSSVKSISNTVSIQIIP